MRSWRSTRGALTPDDAVEELADLLELIHAAAKFHRVTVGELEAVSAEKAVKCGGIRRTDLFSGSRKGLTGILYKELAGRIKERNGSVTTLLPTYPIIN